MADVTIKGFEGLQKQLKAMGAAASGNALRSAVRRAAKPLVSDVKASAPKGSPPYQVTVRNRTYQIDPYPIRPKKYTPYVPGHASRSIATKAVISDDKKFVRLMIGWKPEAWYLRLSEIGPFAQPFLVPTFKSAKPYLGQRVGAFFKAAIRAKSK